MRFFVQPTRFLLSLSFFIAMGVLPLPAQDAAVPAEQLTPQEVREEMKKAGDLQRAQKFQEAIDTYLRLQKVLDNDESLKKSLHWLKPEDNMANVYVQWAIFWQRKKDYKKGMEVLESGLERFPENEVLKKRKDAMRSIIDQQTAGEKYAEGHKLLRKKKYEEAAESFRIAYDLRPDQSAYRDSLLRALSGAERYDEAAVLLEEAVNEALNHPKWDDERRLRQAANLRSQHKDVFNNSGLAARWIGEARERLSDAPTSASLHNYLADLLLENGQRQVALSHYLVAAVELDESEFFVNRVMRFRSSDADPVAQMYYRSLIYHLPRERKALQAVDRLVQPYRNHGRRFALTDEARSYYEEATKAAVYIQSQPGLEPEHLAEAQYRRIEYHYEPLEGQPDQWQLAIEEFDDLSSREGVSEDLKKRIVRKKADIYIEHLNQPDRAYAILEPLFEKSPDRGLLSELFEAAFKMQDPPAPKVLEKVSKQTLLEMQKIEKSDDKNVKRKIRNLRSNYEQYQAALASWYYEMGNPEKAMAVMDGLLAESGIDERVARNLRNSTRRFSRAFHSHLSRVKASSVERKDVLLTQNRVVSTEFHKLGKGQPAHVHNSLQVQVPENLSYRPELLLRMGQRPAVSDPPAFFAPLGDGAFHGTLRPLLPEVPGTQLDTFDFSLSSSWEWLPYSGDVSMQVQMSDLGEAEGVYLAEVSVVSKRAYRMEIEFVRWSQLKGDPVPKHDRQAGRKLIYENQAPTTGTLGRTYEIPITRHTRWEPDAMAPSVEIMIVEKEIRRDVGPEKDHLYPIESDGILVDSAYLRLDSEPASGTLPVLSKKREVYRIGGGR